MKRGLQAVNHNNHLALWSNRVEACRSSGLAVSQWCRDENIPLSTYYSWQRKLFQTINSAEPICFAEVPISPPPSEKTIATLHVNGIRVELHAGASAELIHDLVDALKSC